MPLIGHPPLEKPSLCFHLLCVVRQVRWPSSPLPRDVPVVPRLVWGISLQRSSCGKRRTRGGTGGREGRGKEDAQALSFAGPASGCYKGSATFCAFLGFNTLQSSGVRAGGPVLILEASPFRRKPPPPLVIFNKKVWHLSPLITRML